MTNDNPDATETSESLNSQATLVQADLPDDDPGPDEHGNEPRECVGCNREVADIDPVMTTNRAVDQVNARVTIEPMCEFHDRQDTTRKIEVMLGNVGPDLLARGLLKGVLTKAELEAHLDVISGVDGYEDQDPENVLDIVMKSVDAYRAG